MNFKIDKLYYTKLKIIGRFMGYDENNHLCFSMLQPHNFHIKENGYVHFDKNDIKDFKLYQYTDSKIESERKRILIRKS